MSANKRSDTKIPEDEHVDSGFLSGPCDLYSGEVLPESEVKEEVLCDISEPKNVLDSGVDLCLSECFSAVQICETSLAPPENYVCTVSRHEKPPIVIFFQQDDDGDTQLHIASVHGCEKSVGTLIRVCPNKALLDVANDDGHTPLHLAVMSRNAVVTRMLVHAGLSIGVRDSTGETPLHKAAAAGHVECLHALLASVPEYPTRTLSTALNQKNYNGQACVHLAASAGHVDALHTLVYYGADINLKENLAGWTALHIAAARGDARLVSCIRERCGGSAAAVLHARDYAGRTPRRLARRTAAAQVFASVPAGSDSDTDTDSDDDAYDSDSESLFERLCESLNPINVA